MGRTIQKEFHSQEELARHAARDWLQSTNFFSEPRSVAFSGGRIAEIFFKEVTKEAMLTGVNLGNTHFFWADERCVSPASTDSNFLLAEENFLVPMSIAAEKIHRLKGELPPAEAVREASAALRQFVPAPKNNLPVLDLVFLGLGENGHTASLMPNASDAVKNSTEPFVHVDNSPKPPPNRISMTYALLTAAREVWMLASGQGKKEALFDSLQQNSNTPFGQLIKKRAQTVIYSDIKPG